MAISTVEEALVYTLLHNAGVIAVTTRIYPQVLPQDPTYPSIVYSKVSDMQDQTLLGPSGLAYARFRIDVIAETYAGAKALSNLIRVALDGKTFTVDAIHIKSALSMGETDLYEDVIKCHRISSDFTVWHSG